MTEFASVGLVYDAAGVFLVGFAFLFGSKIGLMRELKPTDRDYNFYTIKQALYRRIDGIAGTLLLLAGFLLQWLASIGISNQAVGWYLLLGLGVFLFTYIFLVRWFLNWIQLSDAIESTNPSSDEDQ